MLGHLSEMGVLPAIASKNELSVVEEAFKRDDLLVPAKCFFPIVANWGAKSGSIAEIPRTWNDRSLTAEAQKAVQALKRQKATNTPSASRSITTAYLILIAL